MSAYRTGLREPRWGRSGYRPSALGGHTFTLVREGVAASPGMFAGDELPTVWRCSHCHLLRASHELREGFLPKPCMGRVRALTAA